MKKILSVVLAISLTLSLTACGAKAPAKSSPTVPPDLSGQWRQINNESEDNYQGAIISDDEIEIYWVSNNGDTRSLYWSGSFDAPDTADEPYSWISQNNTEKTENVALADRADTKAFTYANDQISYSISVTGTTTIVRFEKEEWAPGLEIEENDYLDDSDPEELTYSTVPFPFAGVEFSVPEYYEMNEESPENVDVSFSATKGDYAEISLHSESATVDEFEQIKQQYLSEEFWGAGFDNVKELAFEDIQLAGLSGLSFFAIVKSDGTDLTIHLDIVYNLTTQQWLGLLFIQYGYPQYDYLHDYERMLDTAKLITPESLDSSPAPTAPTGIRTEFKEAMDSYEAFFDEYVDFMEKYTNSTNPAGMLTDYSNYMAKYSDAMAALSRVNDGTLSNEELAYYIEVQSRINQKLLLVGQ